MIDSDLLYQAENETCHAKITEIYDKYPSDYSVLERLSVNGCLPTRIMWLMKESQDPKIRTLIASRYKQKYTQDAVFSGFIAQEALDNRRYTPVEILVELSDDSDPAVLAGVAGNNGAPSDTVLKLASHNNPAVRAAAAANTEKIDLATATKLAEDENPEVLQKIIWSLKYLKHMQMYPPFTISAVDALIAKAESQYASKVGTGYKEYLSKLSEDELIEHYSTIDSFNRCKAFVSALKDLDIRIPYLILEDFLPKILADPEYNSPREAKLLVSNVSSEEEFCKMVVVVEQLRGAGHENWTLEDILKNPTEIAPDTVLVLASSEYVSSDVLVALYETRVKGFVYGPGDFSVMVLAEIIQNRICTSNLLEEIIRMVSEIEVNELRWTLKQKLFCLAGCNPNTPYHIRISEEITQYVTVPNLIYEYILNLLESPEYQPEDLEKLIGARTDHYFYSVLCTILRSGVDLKISDELKTWVYLRFSGLE